MSRRRRYGLYRKPHETQTKAQILMTVPKNDTKVNMPSRDSRFITPGYTHQADLLVLPKDENGSTMALVVVDLGSRLCDAEPLKQKTQAEVLSAFKKIYSRVLKMPKALLQVDGGTEFKGPVANWFNQNKVMIRTGLPGRHRQQATVEAYNALISRAIFHHQYQTELKKKRRDNNWVKILPEIIAIINEHMKEEVKQTKELKIDDLWTRCEKKACELLPVGTLVYIAYDEPRDILTGKKLHGKFRATDIRWDRRIRKISGVILHPGQPPLYKVTNKKGVLYTRNQLQLVKYVNVFI